MVLEQWFDPANRAIVVGMCIFYEYYRRYDRPYCLDTISELSIVGMEEVITNTLW